MDILFYSPQRYNNLCLHSRSLEIFGYKRAFVYDQYEMLQGEYFANTHRRINKMSAGSFFKMDWVKVTDPLEFVKNWPGRTFATVAEEDGASLFDFKFEDSDLLILGQESCGLPAELVAACTGGVTIPSFGETVSLNVGVATGIFLYEIARQKHVGRG